MNYNWNMPLIPGTIICAKYNKFDGSDATGIFCVLYDEQLDSDVQTRKNIVAIKLSTQFTLVSNYSVEVDKERNSFLESKSIACCSKLHILHKSDQVYKILGKLDSVTYTKVFKAYMRFISEIQRQAIDRL